MYKYKFHTVMGWVEYFLFLYSKENRKTRLCLIQNEFVTLPTYINPKLHT